MATQAECADWLDMSVRRFRELIDEGVIDRAEKGDYDLKATIRQYVQNIREVAAGRSGEETVGKMADEARKMKAQADKAELEVAQIRGELIPADQIADVMHAAVQTMKTRLTAIPAKCAPLVGARDVAVAERVIREQVHAALTEIAQCEIIGTAEAA